MGLLGGGPGGRIPGERTLRDRTWTGCRRMGWIDHVRPSANPGKASDFTGNLAGSRLANASLKRGRGKAEVRPVYCRLRKRGGSAPISSSAALRAATARG